jgi:hypothetical protein|tara:strand:+ start:40 stop:429 length:390 start_codon:yes stop_codon:yes gene_type:complete
MKLHKWGAERLLSYYLGIDDWGCNLYDEKKYNPIIKEVLNDCIKTGKLKIPKKYPELACLFSCDMSSGLSMDEMNVKWWEDETPEYLLKYLGIDIESLKLTIKQYKLIIKKLDKLPSAEIQYKKPKERW